LKVAGFLHLISILAVVIAGIELEADWIYWSGAAIFGLLLLRQHRLVRPDDLSRVDLAFFTLNGIASVIFGTLVVLSLLY
jgi:4-hydroxybenzoate polyprenyltransferase